MSRRGNCYDNAVVESFFGTLKTELIHHDTYATRNQARLALFEYLEVFYNRKRRHSALGYRSPAATFLFPCLLRALAPFCSIPLPHASRQATRYNACMSDTAKPSTLRQLRDSGWQSKTVKREIHDNFLPHAAPAATSCFPASSATTDTVIPEINIALLAGHDMLFLGEKGQAKSRLMRSLVRFLDEEIPYLDIPGVAVARRSATSRSPAPASGSSPSTPRTTCRSAGGRARTAMPSGSRRAPSSPTSSARSTRPSWPAA